MKLPPEIFINHTPDISGSESQHTLGTRITHVTLNNGLSVYYEGAEFPQKSLPTPEALYSIGILKSILIESIKIRPSLSSVLSAFNRISQKVLLRHFLRNEYRSPCTVELDNLVLNFLLSWGLNRIIASQFSQTFSHIFDFDNAYYLRLVDMMSETDKQSLRSNPYSEMKRITSISFSREHLQHDMRKMRLAYKLMCYALLIPKIRRCFRYAVSLADISKMQYDNSDRYWACLRTDYDFMGMTNEARIAMLKSMGYSLPVLKEYSI